MEGKSSIESLGSEYTHLAEAFSKIFVSVVEVNLSSGFAITLKSSDTEVVNKKMPFVELLERYIYRSACPEDRAIILEEFSSQQLNNMIECGQKTKAIDVRCGSLKERYEWMSLAAMHIEDKKVLITTRNINEQRLLKSIVDKFVYNNCDYFILLDTKNNSYVRFMGRDDEIPPVSSDDYTTALQEYNKQCVMPYDVARVIDELKIENMVHALESKDDYSFYFDYKIKDGAIRRKRIQMAYQDKSKGLILFSRSDVTEIYRLERDLNEQLIDALIKAQTDSLTQLYNQVRISELITQKISKKDCAEATFLFVDVDNFKMVNDTLGHLKGDYLLKVLAKSLKELVKDMGLVGRIGGDEFIIFFPNHMNKEDIEWYAKKICNIFSEISDKLIKKLDISCSVGISSFPQDGEDYETLARKADQALYDSKRHGKNKFTYYSEKSEHEFFESMISKIDN